MIHKRLAALVYKLEPYGSRGEGDSEQYAYEHWVVGPVYDYGSGTVRWVMGTQ
jgi:hypothetical protein